ncbi:hypothetical protein EV180_007442, partial [Coemansia sp. RSA 518]
MAELAEQTAKLALNDKAPAKAGKAKKGSGAPAPQIERPEFIEHRNRIFEELYQIQQDKVA